MTGEDAYGARGLFCLLAAASLLLTCSPLLASANDDVVVGCSGFVQASAALAKLRKPSDPKLDYSDITVELQNEEGLVKDRIQCAPNGYFFLPVYGKGSFVIAVKGADGWNFEPRQVPVVVDKTSCNDNKDVNFQYTGFSLSGKVKGAPGGPSCTEFSGKGIKGVTVTLNPIGQSDPTAENKAIATSTDSRGRFTFKNLLTGKYNIAATHSSWHIVTIGSTEVELGWGKGQISDVFQVAGYHLQGSVVAQGNPVLGVHVFLYSDEILAISCPVPSVQSPRQGGSALCHYTTKEDGKFVFETLPCGEYTLVPYYKGEATVFDVSPAEMRVSVGHGSEIIERPFEVTGFSVGGRVIDLDGNGIEGVQISVNGNNRALTDSAGRYKLDQVVSAKYMITAGKENYKFESLEDFSVLPNIPSLPDIKPTEFDVCGSVKLDGTQFSVKRSIALTHGPANVKPQAIMTGKEGEFCFTVPPGDYRLSPAITQGETAAGLLFSPSFLDVKVKTKPIINVVFEQGHLSVSGKVKCIEFCPKHVKLSLLPLNSESSTEGQVLHMEEDAESFVFERVIPGKYVIKVENEAPGEEKKYGDRWCWQQNRVEVELLKNNVTDVTFRQKGWVMRINSTFPAQTTAVHDVVESIVIDFKRGMTEVCVPASGEYSLLFMWQCVFFGALMTPWGTDHPEPLNLDPQLYLLEGTIRVDTRLYSYANNLSDFIYPSIFTSEGSPLNQRSFAVIKYPGNESHPFAIYEWSYWGKLGESLMIRPRHNGKVHDDEELSDRLQSSETTEDSELSGNEISENGSEAATLDEDVLHARQEIAQDAQSAETVRDLVRKQAYSNPAITGKFEDSEDLSEKMELRDRALGLKTEGEEEREETATGETGEVSETEEETETETDEGVGEEQEEAEDPYKDVPWAGIPHADPLPTFPPRKRVLFYPRMQFHNIDREECQAKVPEFEARLGIYLEGKVVPPLDDVNITVVAESASVNAGWREGEEVLWTVTQQGGLYYAGPLYDDATYSVKASKPGYDFRAIDKYSFEGQKLSQISVSFKISDLTEEILPPVLLLLSGDGGYRKNLATPHGKGLVFDSLFPGNFYLRPVLKEYSFNPQSLSIDLHGGETKDVVFEATRVAFSVFGKVHSLGSQSEEGIKLEAQSHEGKLYESAETEKNGMYRIRGLVPDTKYSVRVVLENEAEEKDEKVARVERAAPSEVEVKVSNKDAEGVNFVIFYKGEGFEIFGSVEGQDFDKWQPHISVEVSPSHSPSHVEQSVSLPLSGFFEVKGLGLEEYVVRLKFGLSDKTHIFESKEESVDFRKHKLGESSVAHLNALKFKVEERRPDQFCEFNAGSGADSCPSHSA